MADLAREIGSRIRTQAVPGRDVAWVDTLDPLTVTLHGTTQAATNLSGQRLAVGDRVLVQRAGGSMIITHLHEARPQSGVVVGVTPGGDVVVEAGGREIEHVPVVDDASESVAELGRKPASAEGLSVSTWPYTDTDGANRGAVSVSWDPVVEGTDGDSVVVDHYKIAIQHGPDAPWGVVLQTPLTEGEILNLDPGTDLGVTVHAVSEAGVTGPAPQHVRVMVAQDTTPPPVPATPTGVSAMGTVTWTLTGMGVGGVPMPADYQHTILTCTGVRDGATVLSTHTVSGRGTVVAGPYDRGTTATASAVSVDRSGNESDDSPTATVAVKSVMDDSPLGDWRDELEEALETLDTDVLEVRQDLIPPLQQAMTAANTKLGEHTQEIQDNHNALVEVREAALTGSVVEYAVGTSETTPPTSGWSSAQPVRIPGRYIWMRALITYADSSTTTTAPALITGNQGEPGPKGEDGTSVQIEGSVPTSTALPTGLGPGDAGKGWLAQDTGHLWVWSGTGWTDAGEIRGPAGDDGVSIVSTDTYYKRLPAQPPTPAGNPPGSGWTLTEPGYVFGLTLWRTVQVVFSNGSVSYTPPTRVSADSALGPALETRREFARYEWAGTAHGSVSIEYINGVEQRRNLATNPSYEVSLPANESKLVFSGVTYGPRVFAGERALVATATANSDTFTYITQTGVLPAGTSWVGMHVTNAQTVGFQGSVRIRPAFFVSGSWVYGDFSDYLPAYSQSGGTHATLVVPVPAGATSARLLLYLYGDTTGGALSAGQQVTTDAWMIVPAVSEADAWAKLALGYFDGDTPSGEGDERITKAQLSANRRNQIIPAITGPTGSTHPETGEPLTKGDTWWQKDTLGPGGVVIGEWHWDGTGWRSATIGHQVISSVDVNDLNVYGTAKMNLAVMEKLWADGIGTNVLAVTDRIAVGGGNLWKDPTFQNPDYWPQPERINPTGVGPNGTRGIAVVLGNGTLSGQYAALDGGGIIPVTPGATYRISVMARCPSAAIPPSGARVYARALISPDEDDITFTDPSLASNTSVIPSNQWGRVEAHVTVPPGRHWLRLGIYVSSSVTENVHFSGLTVQNVADAVTIGDGAVTATKFLADEAFAMKLGAVMAEFDSAFIGKLEADYVRAGSWIGQLLSGVNIKISNDPDDPLAEHIMLANLAMRIMRGDGDGGLYEATSLGGEGLDQLSMRPSASGSPRVVISGDGNAAFAGHASVGTLAVGGELLSERLARLPQGIMADFPVSGAAIRSWGNTNYGLVRLSWQAQAGRRYKLSMKLNLQGTEGDSYWLTIRTTRGSTQPAVGSAIFAEDYGTIAPNAAVGSTNHDTHEHQFTIMDTVSGTLNALVVIRTWNANREMRLRSGADYASRFTLEDMGFVDGAAVVVDPAGGNPFTGTAPAPAPQPIPRKQTLYRSNWRSFRDGAPYSSASELEHGTYGGIVRRSQLLFPAIPSGATNIRAKLRIRATHTWAGSGATFYIGIGTESSLQTSIPGHSAGAQHHFARGEEREIPLPGWTTSHRSVWLGIGAPGTNAAYGRLDPSSAYIVYDYDLA